MATLITQFSSTATRKHKTETDSLESAWAWLGVACLPNSAITVLIGFL